MYIRLLLINNYDFLSDCPSLMHGIAFPYVQHCQAMLGHGVCELAHSFFHFVIMMIWGQYVTLLDVSCRWGTPFLWCMKTRQSGTWTSLRGNQTVRATTQLVSTNNMSGSILGLSLMETIFNWNNDNHHFDIKWRMFKI